MVHPLLADHARVLIILDSAVLHQSIGSNALPLMVAIIHANVIHYATCLKIAAMTMLASMVKLMQVHIYVHAYTIMRVLLMNDVLFWCVVYFNSTDPRTCKAYGITRCCEGDYCDVMDKNLSFLCSCNASCHQRNDCCPDINKIGCPVRKLICDQIWEKKERERERERELSIPCILHVIYVQQLKHATMLENMLDAALRIQHHNAMLMVVTATVTITALCLVIAAVMFQCSVMVSLSWLNKCFCSICVTESVDSISRDGPDTP